MAAVALLGVSCKRESEPAAYPPQGTATSTGYGGYGGYGQYPPPTATQTAPPPPATAPTGAPPPTATSTAPAPPGPAPVAGFPCYYDSDLQCPFARCIGGRCGGCRSDADCKPGSTCGTSPLGAACIPSAGTGAPPPATAPAPTSQPPATQPPSDPFAAARARCIQRINEYRAKANAAPVSARSDRESCADSQAQSDAAKNTAHGAFGKCGETAQNECPGWKGNVDTVLDSCLAAMFAEGPGAGPAHGHYTNMVEASYKTAACGFYVAPDGSVWIVQDFYR